MRRRVHWTTLVPWLVLVWCATITGDHYLVPDTWSHALGTGLVEIPVWASIGYFTLRRAKHRPQDQLYVEQAPR